MTLAFQDRGKREKGGGSLEKHHLPFLLVEGERERGREKKRDDRERKRGRERERKMQYRGTPFSTSAGPRLLIIKNIFLLLYCIYIAFLFSFF